MGKLIIGCGYLGERVAKRWEAVGEHVWATTRSLDRAARIERHMIWPLYCDVLQPETFANLQPAETILYCVGFDRSAGHSMRQVYVNGLENILQHIQTWPSVKFIQISSTSVYGQADGSCVDEASPTEPLTESGKVVLEAEQLLRSYRPESIVLRFAGIYGPSRLLRSEALLKGEPLAGDPERWLNLIHVDDGASAVLAAERLAPAGATINISDGQPMKRGDFFRELAQLLGAPAPSFDESGPADPANRRIANQRLRELLKLELTFPNYWAGLAGSLGEGGGRGERP
jgi:nucleoside-diphosphate-sugar epimerase